ncbi:MAG: hypothetical protein ACM3NR_02105 [Methanosarcina sp.]
MKSKILLFASFLIISLNAFPQFVGDGAPSKTATPAKANKPTFTLKYGLAMPSGNMGIAPVNGVSPRYSEGYMGAKTGFFAEMGLGLNLTNPDKKVSFYYYPVLAAFWKTELDWSENNDATFDKEEVYVKPLKGFEIAQRYGISFKPMEEMSVSLYYRPGLLIPLNFEITSADFQFMGTMSTNEKAPALILSSTPGLSVQYSMFALTLEKYFVKPTYDITFNPTGPVTGTTVMGKIPVRMTMISLALVF